MEQSRLRNFVFTLNNYTEVDIDQLLCFKCRYMLFAKEVAPTTGTPHLQGYCELSKQTSFGTLVQELPRGIHIEPRRGTQEQAISYIKTPRDKPVPNQEQTYEVGEPRTQGTDAGPSAIETARQLLRVQSPIDPNYHTLGVIKAYERLQRYWPVTRADNNDELSRIWYYGPGGSGKTAAAFHYTRNCRTYKCDLIDKGWFDGYDNHEAVILDDFNPDKDDKDQFKLVLSLLDKYPLRVNVKGASVNWNPKKIVITSQKPPWEYYGDPMTFRERPEVWNTDEQLRQIMRRLDLVIELNSTEHVNYPVVVKSVNSEVSGIVLPRNFGVGRVAKQLIEELTCESKIDDSLDVAGDSSPGSAHVAQRRIFKEVQDCPQGQATSTRVDPADLS